MCIHFSLLLFISSARCSEFREFWEFVWKDGFMTTPALFRMASRTNPLLNPSCDIANDKAFVTKSTDDTTRCRQSTEYRLPIQTTNSRCYRLHWFNSCLDVFQASSNGCHIAMTYSSLCSLLILEDDFQRIDRKAVANGIQHLRTPEGRLILIQSLNILLMFILLSAFNLFNFFKNLWHILPTSAKFNLFHF